MNIDKDRMLIVPRGRFSPFMVDLSQEKELKEANFKKKFSNIQRIDLDSVWQFIEKNYLNKDTESTKVKRNNK